MDWLVHDIETKLEADAVKRIRKFMTPALIARAISQSYSKRTRSFYCGVGCTGKGDCLGGQSAIGYPGKLSCFPVPPNRVRAWCSNSQNKP